MTTRHPYSFSQDAPWATASAPPASRSQLSLLQRLGRGLLVASALAGASLALYRNDLLLLASQKGGVERGYLQLESAWVGGPSPGTPRSLEPLLVRSRAWFERLAGAPGAASVAKAESAPAVRLDAEPRPAATPAKPAAVARSETTSTGVPVVSLDALPVQKSEAPAPAIAPSPLPAVEPRARSAPAPARPKAEPAPQRERAPVRAVAAAPRPEPAKTREPPPAPPPARAAAAPVSDNPLKAAIRSAIQKESSGQ